MVKLFGYTNCADRIHLCNTNVKNFSLLWPYKHFAELQSICSAFEVVWDNCWVYYFKPAFCDQYGVQSDYYCYINSYVFQLNSFK